MQQTKTQLLIRDKKIWKNIDILDKYMASRAQSMIKKYKYKKGKTTKLT